MLGLQFAEIRIDDCCRVDRYLAQDLALRRDEICVIQSDRGVELGRVVHVFLAEEVPDDFPRGRQVLRRAGAKDVALFQKKRQKEEKAWEVCRQLVEKHCLVMKLTRVEYLFDGSKVVFYYTADGRVDFRSLVKDLASALKTRIEMRQIGVRDEAKLLGGVGCCGLPLCCSTWLQRFQPVSIKTAKHQCLNLNPSRLSGVCGRLMCCLTYESASSTPEGRSVRTARGAVLPESEGQDLDLPDLSDSD